MKDARVSTKIRAFGWLLHHMKAQPGSWFDIAVSRRCSVAEMGAYAFQLSGHVKCSNIITGQPRDDRVPGMMTINQPDMEPGIYRFAAQVESEWICIDRYFNGGEFPPVSGIRLLAGENLAGKILVCTGTDALSVHDDGYTATEDCYVLSFERAKATAL